MLIDTHSHYNLEPFFSENQKEKVQLYQNVFKYVETWRSYWNKAQSVGINKSIVVGTDFFTSTSAVGIAENEKGLFASVGIHPNAYHDDFLNSKQHQVNSYDSLIDDVDTDIQELRLIIGNKKVVAVGETGLDYYRLPKEGEELDEVIKLQKYAFEQHIKLAIEKDLPLIVHVRDRETPEEKTSGNAYWDAVEILQKHDVKNFTLHCVSGPLSYVKAAVEMGGYMGFDGNITYPNAQRIREIFAIVPEDRRLVETDAPFLPPQEFRGKTCEPWMLVKTVEYIVNELHSDPEIFAENALRLFSKMNDE